MEIEQTFARLSGSYENASMWYCATAMILTFNLLPFTFLTPAMGAASFYRQLRRFGFADRLRAIKDIADSASRSGCPKYTF